MKALLVLLLLGGVAALLIVPKVSKGVEVTLAEDAVAIVRMVATTNQMYTLDFHGKWANGPIDNSCNSGDCTAHNRGALHGVCNLLVCKYRAAHDWDAKKYNFFALDPRPGPSTTNPCGTFSDSKAWVACAVRKTAADGDAAAPKFSAGWGYAIGKEGAVVTALQAAGAEATPPPPR
jgi:competence protein ComGC